MVLIVECHLEVTHDPIFGTLDMQELLLQSLDGKAHLEKERPTASRACKAFQKIDYTQVQIGGV